MSSPVLDLAIGMIFIYLLMSLLCSALQELISNILKLRAKNLQHGVGSLRPSQACRMARYRRKCVLVLIEAVFILA